ncbi:MAG TPA: glycosyltransferase family 4 protein [Vicinamibacterales bacterium]|nr:glycosyltransferase family 4 protein [Vicinamibacterales bacterium]
MDRWLLIAGDFTPLGGMDRANHALALGLARRQAHVDLVTHRAWPDLSLPNVGVRTVSRPLGSHLLGLPRLVMTANRAARRFPGRIVGNGGNATSPDITWIHYLHAAYTPTAAGGTARLTTAAAARYYRRRERTAIGAARYIVCNSRRTAVDVARAFEVAEDRLRVVYYGSDPAAFAPADDEVRRRARLALGWPEERPVVLFAGALGDRRKGFDRVFEAWTTLATDGAWDMDLAVVGHGAELPAWRARAARAGLQGIRFLGFRRDVATIMAACDVMVHPARYEAYGLAVHESLCRGVPVIVSAAAGVAERYSGPLRELLIDEPESAGEIAARLRRWREGRQRYALAAASVGEQLRARTWDDMAAEFVRAVAA